jgi:hypothetical protein
VNEEEKKCIEVENNEKLKTFSYSFWSVLPFAEEESARKRKKITKTSFYH